MEEHKIDYKLEGLKYTLRELEDRYDDLNRSTCTDEAFAFAWNDLEQAIHDLADYQTKQRKGSI